MNKVSLGEEIKKVRVCLGMTREILAEKTGFSESEIEQVENEMRVLSEDEYLRILTAFGIAD